MLSIRGEADRKMGTEKRRTLVCETLIANGNGTPPFFLSPSFCQPNSNAHIPKTEADPMTKPPQRRRSSKANVTADLVGCDAAMRAALAKHLHDLLNSLWPASVRIELSITEETCPPMFRETLVELRRCVEEAMSIASQADALLHSPTSNEARS